MYLTHFRIANIDMELHVVLNTVTIISTCSSCGQVSIYPITRALNDDAKQTLDRYS
jgi:RNase P subunit RPR2